MEKKLNILMISSEMVPFAKTGGLADVVGTLPSALAKRGHNVRVVIPNYSSIPHDKHKIDVKIGSMCVWMGNVEEWCTVYETRVKEDVPVYFIEHNAFFGRDGLYHDRDMNDYLDNPRRFAFLTRAGLQLCKDTDFAPDIVHVHDWQTALAAGYLKTWEWNNPTLGNAASVLTIHNAAYQGVYGPDNLEYLGIGEQNFHPDAYESHGYINFLKGGIFFSDLVTTVSPGYAHEINSPYGGFGLAPYLTNKGDSFFGILNGVDYEEWSPEHDTHIPAKYTKSDLSGKATCKAELQKHFGLEADPDVAIFAAIGRFVHQKGFHLISQCIEEVLNTMKVQFVMLGSGDAELEGYFGTLPGRYPGRAGSYIGYNIELSHLIEAGADFFIMPSLYEPCGLNQLYSLRYGTLPVVRATGGLDDTVEQYDESTGGGTGYKFWHPTPESLRDTIGWAVSTYYDRPKHMKMMIEHAMGKDFSWDKSTDAYEKAYEKALKNKRNYDSWPR